MKLLIDIGNTTTSVGLWSKNQLYMTNYSKNNKLLSSIKKYFKKEIDEIFFTSVIGAKENELIISRLKEIYKCGLIKLSLHLSC